MLTLHFMRNSRPNIVPENTCTYAVSNPFDRRSASYKLTCLKSEQYIGPHMRKERSFYESFCLYFLATTLPKNGNILDIGAHIGTYATYLSRCVPLGRVFAFEPQLPIFKLLQKNLYDNGIQNCTPYQLGAAHRYCTSAMERTSRDGMGIGLAPTYQGDAPRYNYGGLALGIGGQKVKCVPLSTFCSRNKIRKVDLIKVDVEGAEPFVFFGARHLIRRCRPVIIFESNSKRVTKQMANGLGAQITSHSACFDVRSCCSEEQGYLYLRLRFHDNIVLLPKERLTHSTKRLLKFFSKERSDSDYFSHMYVLRQDPRPTQLRSI
ncbi:MAG: FkbM family methyltransferase [Oligoflexia bacterium]|nr:FkbM family methyltransferase [Oligoflexia bacterium]